MQGMVRPLTRVCFGLELVSGSEPSLSRKPVLMFGVLVSIETPQWLPT